MFTTFQAQRRERKNGNRLDSRKRVHTMDKVSDTQHSRLRLPAEFVGKMDQLREWPLSCEGAASIIVLAIWTVRVRHFELYPKP
jgi:hypothetical protein